MSKNSKLFKPMPREEILYFVKARQKNFKYSTEIYIPRTPYLKTDKNFEPIEKLPKSSSDKKSSQEEKLERSIRYTRTAVRDLALTNTFTMFATFTFREDRENQERCRSKMSGWTKRQRKHDKHFQYLIVPELHADGVSLHFHALISGYQGRVIRARSSKTGRPLVKGGRKVYDFPSYTLGNSEVYHIDQTASDSAKSSFYIAKYIRKDMPLFDGKKRFWASRGLARPTVIENPNEWYYGLEPDHMIETDYGKFLYFNNEKIKEAS